MSMEASHAGPAETIISSWWLAFLVGVVLIALGLASILGLFIVATAFTLLLGLILIITGLLMIILAFSDSRTAKSKIMSGAIGLAALAAGAYLLFHPGVGLAVTTLVLAVFFPVEGVAKISMALGMRSVPRWWWMLLSGIVSIAFGVFIWINGLSIASGYVGLLLGADLLFLGFALIMIALSTRTAHSRA